MSQLNKAGFLALYGSAGTTFPDNTTGEISEADMRQFGQDIADSFDNIIDVNVTFPNSDFNVTITPWQNFSGSNGSGNQNFFWESGGFLRANGSPENSKYLAVGRSSGWPAGDYVVSIRAKNDSTYGGSGGDAIGIGVWTMPDGLNQTTVPYTGSSSFPRDNTFYTRTISFTISASSPYLAFTLSRNGGGGTFDINAVIDYIHLDSFIPTEGNYATEDYVNDAIAAIDLSDLSGAIANSLILETVEGIWFSVGENISVLDSSWSAFFGENHTINGIFNDGIVAGEVHFSEGIAGNNAIFGRDNALTGTGTKNFNLMAGDGNVINATGVNSSLGNFIVGIGNTLIDSSNSAAIGTGINLSDVDNTLAVNNLLITTLTNAYLGTDADGNVIDVGVPSAGLQDVLNTDSVLVDTVSSITGPNGINMQFGVSSNGLNGLDFTANEVALWAPDISIVDDINAGNMGLVIAGGTGELDLFTGSALIQMLGSSGVINFTGTAFNFNNDIDVDGAVVAQEPGGGNLNLSGTIYKETSSNGNIGTGDDTLKSFSLPAGSLAVNDQNLLITAAGSFANTVNNKRIRFKFGSDTIFDTGALAITSAADWTLTSEIIRTGATTQKCITKLTTSSSVITTVCDYATATQTLSGAITVALTGEATADNDVVAEMIIIRFEP